MESDPVYNALYFTPYIGSGLLFGNAYERFLSGDPIGGAINLGFGLLP